MRFSRSCLALAATGLTLIGGGQAVAATPESGSLSSSSPRFGWAGDVTASWAFRNAADATGQVTGSAPVGCEAPFCDSVKVTVAEAGKYLLVGADAPAPES